MSRTLEVFEHGTLRVGSGAGDLRDHEFSALVRWNDRHERLYFEVGHRRLRARSFVGYVEVGDLAIEILPKADRGTSDQRPWRAGLLEMLGVALGLRLRALPAASQQLTRRSLLDLIAQAYVAEVERLLHQGLAKGYRGDESNGPVFRGRLKIADHLRENVARADRFYVAYQTYDHDVPVNRVLAAALEALSWCALSPPVASRVKACLAGFPPVQIIGTAATDLDRLSVTRATVRYADALTYARMILAHQGPQLRGGTERVFALLFDMNLLWERYIAVLLRRTCPADLTVSTQERHALWAPPDHTARRVRPDVVVRRARVDGPGSTVLVIDTKWKVPDGLPSDDDLKQMFVYNELLASPRSMLLYPATATSVPTAGTFASRPHRCEQAYVGVFADGTWSTRAIRDHLRVLLHTLVSADDATRA